MMNRARWLALAAAACCATLVACGGGGSGGPVAPTKKTVTAKPNDDRSGFDGKDVTFYRSDRLGLYLPLPDRASWAITDNDLKESGWLVATHSPTTTAVRVHRYEETSLVGRRECEQRATLSGELPRAEERGEEKGWQTLEDEPVHSPKGWDGWRWVAFEPAPGGSLVGHVYLVAGKSHNCLVVHVLTRVRTDTEVDALADRLELFAQRIVPGIALDRAAQPDDLEPSLPPMPPAPAGP
jgi:hypothetical protein